MKSKITTNSQLSTTEPRKQTKLTKQRTRIEQNHRNGDHMEGYQQGRGQRENGGKGIENNQYNWQVQNRQWEVKNSIGNGESKELICMAQGHELRLGDGEG